MEFLLHIFGEQTISFYLAAIFFLLLGQVTNKIIVFNRRPVEVSFKLGYWIKDNWFDVLVTLTLAFVVIRFTDDIVNSINNFAHIDLGFIVDKMFYYFAVGLVFQTLLHWLRKKITFIRSMKQADGQKRGIIRPDGTPLSGGK